MADILASWRNILILFFVFTTYLIIGMICFHVLEAHNEEHVRKDTRNYKEEILANLTCVTSEDLERLIAAVSYAINNGIDPAKNASSPSNWGYSSSFFFSGTVVTTIGYGHISPNTRYGRSFCIVYALVGIPICAILLAALGDQFKTLKDKILRSVNDKITTKWLQKAFNIFFVFGVGMLLFIVFPAVIFRAIEGWSYHEAWYYCFVTLTTIGFGDFVVGQNPEIQYPTIYKIMVFYWLLLGLVFVAAIIQDVSDTISSKVVKNTEHAEVQSEKEITIENGDTEKPDVSIQNGTKYLRVNTDEKDEQRT